MMSIDSSFRAAFLATAVFGCASGAAVAADTQAAWVGFMQNTPPAASTTACVGVGGTAVGDIHVSIYRPHILTTDTPTFLAVVFLRGAFTLQNFSETANPQMNGSGADIATIIDGRGKAVTPPPKDTYSGIVVTPNPISPGYTGPIIITGRIDSYFNVSGCNVTFKATYGIE
jgi:hypothetical protein